MLLSSSRLLVSAAQSCQPVSLVKWSFNQLGGDQAPTPFKPTVRPFIPFDNLLLLDNNAGAEEGGLVPEVGFIFGHLGLALDRT